MDRVRKLFSTRDLSDVTFAVGEGDTRKEFRAHRLLLSMESDVFKTMFYGSLPEGVETIQVPDLHPDGFDAMLRYVYGHVVQFDSAQTALRAFAVAHVYLMGNLKQICYDYLVYNATPDVACCMYEVADLFDSCLLKGLAVHSFMFKTETIIDCDSFLSAQQSTVQTILRQDTLSVPSERQLFDAVLRWGKANAINERDPDGDKTVGDIQAVVEPLLPYIRFMSMSAVEFTEGPVKSGVLRDEDVLPLLMNIHSPGSRSVASWVCRKPPRKYAWESISESQVCTRQSHDSKVPVRCLETYFSVTGKDVILLGVKLIVKSLPDVFVFTEFENEAQNYRVEDYDVYKADDNGEYSIMLSKPLLIYKGDRCELDIQFTDAVFVSECDHAVNSTPGVSFSIESAIPLFHIHSFVYTVLD